MTMSQKSLLTNQKSRKEWYNLWFQKADNYEFWLCNKANQLTRVREVKSFFCIVSRLGDGVFWYTVMLILPVIYGMEGVVTSLYMIISGIICALTYKSLKNHLARERPYISFSDINAATPALDKYSFPSGHTMHAICFNTVLAIFIPLVALLVMPFTIMVMLSRVILGLHYPSDVVIGAVLGASIALLVSLTMNLSFLIN